MTGGNRRFRTSEGFDDAWAARSTGSGRYLHSKSRGYVHPSLRPSASAETDPLLAGRIPADLDAGFGYKHKPSLWDPAKSDDPESHTDFFRFVDTKMRRVEAGGTESSRVRLTGARRQLKDVLGAIGHIRSVYPFIANDGAGGVFAEWKAGGQRIEIVIEQDLSAYASISDNGETVWFFEFDPNEKLPFDEAQRLRQVLNNHSIIVNRLNPQWRRLFTAG